MALGRGYRREEDSVRGADPVVVLSHRLWERRFGRDPEIVGRSLALNGHGFTVIGVAREGFVGADLANTPDLWVPLAMQPVIIPSGADLLSNPGSWWLRGVARLSPGIDADRAGAIAAVAQQRLATANPATLAETAVTVRPVRGGAGPSSQPEMAAILALFLAIPGLVLLIACANVANLLLGRAIRRRREIGVRVAPGAGRGRITRQLLTESGLLGIMGGILGLVLATIMTTAGLRLIEAPADLAAATRVDWRVLAFALGASVLAGLLFGVVAALSAGRIPAVRMVRGDFEVAGTRWTGSRLIRGLVVAQVAACLTMVVGSGLLVRSLSKALSIPLGFEPKGVALMSFDLGLQGYSAAQRAGFYRELDGRVRQLPGVSAVSMATYLPLGDRQTRTGFVAVGAAEGPPPLVSMTHVWPGLAATLGMPLVAGRDFGPNDGPGAPRVAIVNQTLAQRAWPGQDPLGRQFHLGDSTFRTVIGVIRDAKYGDLMEDPQSYLMLAEQQESPGREIVVVARGSGDPGALSEGMRTQLALLDKHVPVFTLASYPTMLRGRTDKLRAGAKALSGFGIIALLLAVMGLYGVMSLSAASRRREMGIRLALGASTAGAIRLLMSDGLRLVMIGIAIGTAMSVALAKLLEAFLYGIEPADGVAFVGAAGLLAVVAVVACYLPARRGSQVEPALTLKTE